MPRQYYAQRQRGELSGSKHNRGKSYTSIRIADADGNFYTYRIDSYRKLEHSGSISVYQVSFGYCGARRAVLVEIDDALDAGEIVELLN